MGVGGGACTSCEPLSASPSECYDDPMIVIQAATLQAASARSDIEARLRAAGATDSRRAIELVPAGPAETAALDEAIGLGRIVRTARGQLFLNPAASEQPGGETAMGLLLMLLVLASVLATVVTLIAAFKD